MKYNLIKYKAILISLALTLVIGIGLGVWFATRGSSGEPLARMSKTMIDSTANRITEIKRIGQWEFMTVDCEVLVDTVRKRGLLLPDDRLARIYRGKARIGVDLANAQADWIATRGDSAVTVTLPRPTLLDSHFADEAASTVFYERGRWDAKANIAMRRTAEREMARYALTPVNIEAAEQEARDRFETLFRALGFSEISVQFR